MSAARTIALGEHGPNHPGVLCSDGHDCIPVTAAFAQIMRPATERVGPVRRCVEHRPGSKHEQASEVRVACLRDPPQARLTARAVLARHQANQAASCPPLSNSLTWPIIATCAVEVVSPTPWSFISLWANAQSRAIVRMWASYCSMRSSGCETSLSRPPITVLGLPTFAHYNSSNSTSCAPSHKTLAPRARRCSLPSTMVRKWLPASCPILLAKLQAP